jgi:hypothetical protein
MFKNGLTSLIGCENVQLASATILTMHRRQGNKTKSTLRTN